jgi:pullulanase/glycogen debranching enzyme
MKEMVQALHKAGIGVIMDVVYNHTYNLDSPLQKTVPYYYYREWEDGTISNGSDCGNETASEREMFRRFMVRSVCYWAKEYHIDGFRFDLMALHDTETMNAIRTALNRMPRGEEILVYGEPWKAAASAMQEGYFPSDKQNIGRLMDGISMFCDDTRDSIKGSVFIAAEGGYVNGKERLSAGILSATDGWMDGKGAYEPRNASQLIPYVSAHDNYTLWDKLKLSDPKRKEDAEPDFDKMDERTLSMNRLAAGIVMTCKGMPFFQAGEEFARTKHGEGNSFKSSWQLNKIDWTRALEQEELVDYYRGLLALRRKFQAYGTCEPDCKKTFFRENQIAGYELEYPNGRAVCVFYNPWEKEALQKLPEGNWKLLCDGKRCAEDGAEMKESMMLPAKSMVLLARE